MTSPVAPVPSGSPRTSARIALAGNPNCGKTTLFNCLTGARQHVGNYPGVTVEKKEGKYTHAGMQVDVIDLPGTYSLTAYSPEELVARNVILDETPDVVVDVVDASNLERNLYLAVQFMELGVPLVIALNMTDVAEARGYRIDIPRLSSLLGVRIVPLVANRGTGISDLKDAIGEAIASPSAPPVIRYTSTPSVQKAVDTIAASLSSQHLERPGCPVRWQAIKLLENDTVVQDDIRARATDAESILAHARTCRDDLAAELGDDAEILVADQRYGFISGACQQAVRTTVEARHTISDRIDLVMTNRVLSIPIFLGLMYLVFKLTFALGDPFMGWIEGFFGWLGDTVTGFWPEGSESLLQSLLVDGVIGGVGGVLTFLPNIVLLFLAIALLEDSGYMARAAFIMDRLMNKIGLHGKSFIPMLIGFGCTVPAIMATRTLETRRDRLTTMLVAPLMSCGARLPIYALIIPAFFPAAWHARMLWIIYFTGIALAIVCARLLRSTLFKGDVTPFVMELPPYRLPTIRGVFVHMWERSWLYMKKAGTIILGISVIMWALATFPRYDAAETEEASATMTEEQAEAAARTHEAAVLSHTIAGRIGHALEPVIRPLGFDWRIGTALVGSFAAKEVFVAQMGIVYAVGEADEESAALRDKLRDNYSPLQAFCIMIFCLISAPCMATIAVTKRESNSWKWALFQLVGLTVLAYGITLAIYQIGTLAGIGNQLVG
jgi:ferrous iron transport protein B